MDHHYEGVVLSIARAVGSKCALMTPVLDLVVTEHMKYMRVPVNPRTPTEWYPSQLAPQYPAEREQPTAP